MFKCTDILCSWTVGFKANLHSRMASTSDSSHHHTASVPSEQDSNTIPPSFVITETYAPQDPFQLYRLATATPFHCSRCKREKKAKLVATQDSRWDTLLCNGCYGLNLSKRRWVGMCLAKGVGIIFECFFFLFSFCFCSEVWAELMIVDSDQYWSMQLCFFCKYKRFWNLYGHLVTHTRNRKHSIWLQDYKVPTARNQSEDYEITTLLAWLSTWNTRDMIRPLTLLFGL